MNRGKKTKPINYVASGSRLTFIRKTKSGNYIKGTKITKSKALYRCICGKDIECTIENAKYGSIKSCGCLHRDNVRKSKGTHLLSQHPLFFIWKSIFQRCYNPSNSAYKDYGGRGIVVCDEWLYDFKCFYDWAVLNKWKSGMHIDKDTIPYRLGLIPTMYSPSTCLVLDRTTNMNCKRNNRQVVFNGISMNLGQWAKIIGIGQGCLSQRIKSGWSHDKIFSTPVKKYKSRNTCKQQF